MMMQWAEYTSSVMCVWQGYIHLSMFDIYIIPCMMLLVHACSNLIQLWKYCLKAVLLHVSCAPERNNASKWYTGRWHEHAVGIYFRLFPSPFPLLITNSLIYYCYKSYIMIFRYKTCANEQIIEDGCCRNF